MTSTLAPNKEETPSGAPRRRTSLQPRYLPYLLLVPALVFELLVHVIPMVTGVVNSFRQLDLYSLREWFTAPFNGLTNYEVAVDVSGEAGTALLQSFAVTPAFTVVSVGISWFFGMFAATMLQSSFRGRAVLRTLFLVPYALPVYVGVITWKFMFNRDNGVINSVLA
jgi:multiple sugar transport system permease protein